MRKLVWGAGGLLAAVLLVGCGLFGGSPSPRPQTQDSPEESASASESATASPSASPTTVVIEDGRHPVYIRTLDVPGRKITFDLVNFLTGTAATKAYLADHPGGTLDTDYYIQNNNPKLRTLPVSLDVAVSVVNLSGPFATNSPLTFGLMPSHYGTSLPDHLFWLTVSGGQIVRIDEQYLP
jgi:hypothetical protein